MFKILIHALKTLSRNELIFFVAFFLTFVFSFISLGVNFFEKKTILAAVSGGRYAEGVVGQPSFINPVFADNNDADRDLIELLFSDVADLAESYKSNENGKIWNVRLKEGVIWHNGEPITSDDLIFTIKTIQNPDSRSPLLSGWQGIAAERVSEREVKLILPETYVFFESTLKELRPIPASLFESLPVSNLRLSDYNLEPIGSGPFKFVSFKKERSGFIEEYLLSRNELYFNEKPYLKDLVLMFYQNEEELIKDFNSGIIDGFGGLSIKNISKISINHQVFKSPMSRYYAIFFNPQNETILKDESVRQALNYAVNKKFLVEKVFGGEAVWPVGPLMPGMKGCATDILEKNFSIEKANQILGSGGWTLRDDGIREKVDKKESKQLEFDMVVPQISFLIETANLIKEDWSKIGVDLKINIRSISEINDESIKNREYEMLIFGNIFRNGDVPDLSSFWHSSERFYPGFNLSLYENKKADSLIESIRKNLNERNRERDLAVLQRLIIEDAPAIFLYSPYYFYVSKKILKGFESDFVSLSSDRFKNIEKWHVKTARVFK